MRLPEGHGCRPNSSQTRALPLTCDSRERDSVLRDRPPRSEPALQSGMAAAAPALFSSFRVGGRLLVTVPGTLAPLALGSASLRSHRQSLWASSGPLHTNPKRHERKLINCLWHLFFPPFPLGTRGCSRPPSCIHHPFIMYILRQDLTKLFRQAVNLSSSCPSFLRNWKYNPAAPGPTSLLLPKNTSFE